MDHMLVLWKDLSVSAAQEFDGRVAREEEDALVVRLSDGDVVA